MLFLCILLFTLIILIIYIQHKIETKKQYDTTNAIRLWLASETKKKMEEKAPSNIRKAVPYLSDAYAVVTHKRPKREEKTRPPELTLLQQRYT